jgi:hypothetical protein
MGAAVLTYVCLAAAPAMPPAVASEPAVSATAAPARADAAKPVPAKGQAPKATAARPETIEEIVARVQRRLAMETARPARKAASTPAPAAPGPRVTLVWRPSIVWPPELLAAGSDSDPAVTDRVTLSWDDAATP